jgi:hypothetical protein
MTSEARRPIYFGSREYEAEPANAEALKRMERIAEVRIAVGELEAARYARELETITKKEVHGK